MFRIIATLVFLALMCAPAMADVIDVKYHGVDPHYDYHVTFDGSSKNVFAGLAKLELDTDPTNVFKYGFCIEGEDNVGSGFFRYTMTEVDGNSPIGYKYAAWVLKTYGIGTSPVEKTARQLAIWELLYDGTGSDFDNGLFYISKSYSGNEQTAINKAGDILDEAPGSFDANYDFAGALTLVASNNPDTQDFIIPGDPSTQELPVPGAVWLLGSGLFGLVALRKRVKS